VTAADRRLCGRILLLLSLEEKKKKEKEKKEGGKERGGITGSSIDARSVII